MALPRQAGACALRCRCYQPVASPLDQGIYPDRVAARGPRSPGDELEVTPSLRIPLDELAWRFSASGGPGGQHANTSNTRVELTWDVASSVAPGPRQRALLVERLGRVVRVVVAVERSQARNRELALDRLRTRVASALRVDPPRRPTRPTSASRERRLDAKRRHAQLKRDRRADPEG